MLSYSNAFQPQAFHAHLAKLAVNAHVLLLLVHAPVQPTLDSLALHQHQLRTAQLLVCLLIAQQLLVEIDLPLVASLLLACVQYFPGIRCDLLLPLALR